MILLNGITAYTARSRARGICRPPVRFRSRLPSFAFVDPSPARRGEGATLRCQMPLADGAGHHAATQRAPRIRDAEPVARPADRLTWHWFLLGNQYCSPGVQIVVHVWPIDTG